jgi:hypothetical protein
MKSPQLFESPRFKRSFLGLSAALTSLVYDAVHGLVRLYNSDSKNFLSSYGRVERIKKRIVIEIDVSGASRMVADVNGSSITLLNVGDHGTVDRYPAQSLLDDIQRAVRARAGFWPGNGRFVKPMGEVSDERYEIFADEFDPEWIYYLSDQQKGIVDFIRKQTVRAHADEPRFFTIAGGPGTGKTSILLKLLIDLQSANRTKPVLVVSKELAEHIKQCLKGINLPECHIDHREMGKRAYRLDRFDRGYNVLLFDDPRTEEEVEAVLDAAVGICKVVVVAFDPCQLHADITDSDYESLFEKYDVKRAYVLTQC